MFRRKEDSREDSLFDNSAEGSAPSESATVVAPASSPASPAAATASAPSSNPLTSSSPSSFAVPSQPVSRPMAEAARPATPTASAFRANANPITGDLTRGRMPEPKNAMASAASAAAVADKTKGGRRVLTVGNDILLKGEIATCDRLVIEGKVDATLNEVHTVEIAETGSFKGAAHIEDAEISGLFEGELIVRNRLVIYATGKVRGKISYGEIEIERGGELTGEIKTTSGQSTAARPSRPATAKQDDKVAA